MNDFDLPKTFEELQENPPEGFVLSNRVIDPSIFIDKVEDKIVARLSGVRVVNGIRYVYPTLTNSHTWIFDGKTIRPLPRDVTRRLRDLLPRVDLNDISYSRAMQMIQNENGIIPIEPSKAFLQAGNIAAKDLSGELVINGLVAKLFPYQMYGVRWMWETVAHTGGLILADEMGLGKTLQIIALLLIKPPQQNSPALIICPTSLIANWVREFLRFAPDMTVMIHRGAERTGVYKGLQKTSVVITTYDTMVNDISIFSSFEWSWVICDEAQAIKNPDSNRRQAIATIPRRNSIPMTGTPVENSLLDLWSLVDFAIPSLLGSRKNFESKYPDTTEAAKTLARITDPIILKRKVKDVAKDLPERIDIDIPIELDNRLTDYYLEVRDITLAAYPFAGPLVATLRLQLVCAHPWLCHLTDSNLEDDEVKAIPTAHHPLLTPKLERTIALIREAFFSGRKVLVFAIFNRVGDLIKEAFGNDVESYWGAINGATPQDERQKIVDNFSSHKGPGCLILNPKAAGSGLNITAATVAIHFTPVWNPALEAQASARAHRRGQTEPVTIYRLFYKDTVEEVMMERSLWKRDLANESIPVSSRDATDLKRALEIKPRKI